MPARPSLARPAVGAAVLAAAGLSWGLWRYGAAQTWELQRLFLVTLASAAIVTASLPLRRGELRPLLPLLVVGSLLLIQILRLPTLESLGYVLAAVGWLGVFLGLTLSGRGPSAGRDLSRPLTLALVGLGAAEALFGLVQALGGIDAIGTYQRNLEEIATGTFINRNHFAGLLNMSLALALGLLWYGLSRRRTRRSAPSETRAWSWLIVLACAFIGLAIVLSQSRGGTISLVLTVAFFAGLLALDRRRGGQGRALPWILLMTVLGLGLAVGLDALLARFSQLEERQGRVQVYADTLELLADHSLAGVGPGMYRWAFRPYQTDQTQIRYDHAHNDYLQAAAEWGLPVALLLWGFVFWRFYRACRFFLVGSDPWRRGLALGCAGAILSILLHSLVDFNLQIPANLLVFGLVLGLAWSAELHSPAPAGENGGDLPHGARLGTRVGFLALALLAGWTVFPHQRAAALGQEGASLESLQAAHHWNPDDPLVHYRLGIAYRDLPQHQDLERARQHLERAVELNPYAWTYRRQLAVLYELSGHDDDARATYQEATRLNPRSASHRWRLANFELRQGDLDAAAEEIGRALALDPSLARPGLSLLVKAGVDGRRIERTWPRDFDSRRRLLHLATNHASVGALPDAEPLLGSLWRELLAASEPLSVEDGALYVRHLLSGPSPHQAQRAWIELTERNGLADPDYRSGTNLVWNGDFERPLTGDGLGWRVRQADGFEAERAEDGGSTVLRLVFDGTTNLAFEHLEQRVVAPSAGPYRLEARVRAEEISTDQGLALDVWDGGGRRLLVTEVFTGTTPWQTVAGTLSVPADDPRVTLRLRRQRSLRIDNKLRGSFWIDDVRLTPVPAETPDPAPDRAP